MAVKRLITEGYLKREGEYGRPVLSLTRPGRALADRIDLDADYSPRSGGSRQGDRDADNAAAILACVADLTFPLGVTRLAQVLTGSRDSKLIQWGLHHNVAYGRLSGTTQEDAKMAVKRLITEGYLKREGEYGRPVLSLTRAGRALADRIDPDALAGEIGRQDSATKRGNDRSSILGREKG